MDTHNKTIEYGRHKGELFTRLPISYLKWMCNEKSKQWELAKAELERRGTTTLDKLQISGHAIDRASLRHLDKWGKTSIKDEGIHSWLYRLACEALEKDGEKVKYKGMTFVFDRGELYPSLKTIF